MWAVVFERIYQDPSDDPTEVPADQAWQVWRTEGRGASCVEQRRQTELRCATKLGDYQFMSKIEFACAAWQRLHPPPRSFIVSREMPLLLAP